MVALICEVRDEQHPKSSASYLCFICRIPVDVPDEVHELDLGPCSLLTHVKLIVAPSAAGAWWSGIVCGEVAHRNVGLTRGAEGVTRRKAHPGDPSRL